MTFADYLVYLEKKNPALNWELIKQDKATIAELKECFQDRKENERRSINERSN